MFGRGINVGSDGISGNVQSAERDKLQTKSLTVDTVTQYGTNWDFIHLSVGYRITVQDNPKLWASKNKLFLLMAKFSVGLTNLTCSYGDI